MSSLRTDQVREQTTWTFTVEPPTHVLDPYRFSKQATWSLITQVDVVHVIAADGERSWSAEALGVSATKAGVRRGTYTGTVYGDEADALCAEATTFVKDVIR